MQGGSAPSHPPSGKGKDKGAGKAAKGKSKGPGKGKDKSTGSEDATQPPAEGTPTISPDDRVRFFKGPAKGVEGGGRQRL